MYEFHIHFPIILYNSVYRKQNQHKVLRPLTPYKYHITSYISHNIKKYKIISMTQTKMALLNSYLKEKTNDARTAVIIILSNIFFVFQFITK